MFALLKCSFTVSFGQCFTSDNFATIEVGVAFALYSVSNRVWIIAHSVWDTPSADTE